MVELGFSSVAQTVNVAPTAFGQALSLVTVVVAVDSIFGSDPTVLAAVSTGKFPDLRETVGGIGIIIPFT